MYERAIETRKILVPNTSKEEVYPSASFFIKTTIHSP